MFFLEIRCGQQKHQHASPKSAVTNKSVWSFQKNVVFIWRASGSRLASVWRQNIKSTNNNNEKIGLNGTTKKKWEKTLLKLNTTCRVCFVKLMMITAATIPILICRHVVSVLFKKYDDDTSVLSPDSGTIPTHFMRVV